MKTKYLLYILTFLFAGCESSPSDTSGLELSESTFENVSSNGAALTVNITSPSSWTAASSDAWCSLSPNEGTGSQTLGITVGANLNTTERNATIAVTSAGTKKIITITQQAAGSTSGESHHSLPVIFHVMYKDRNAPLQYVSQSRLAKILSTVNKLYKDKTKSVDMNLTFTLASTAPDGKKLTTPGVEYIQWAESYPIDCDKFMNENTGKYVHYLWDPNQYINVMIYNFTSDITSGTTTLGISHLPFSTKGANYLEGTNSTSYAYLEKGNLKFPYSASINSLYINEESTADIYNTSDVTVTLAHELGHYLGLHHTFTEDEKGDIPNRCQDTDYCADTPSYNKVEYDNNVDYIGKYDEINYTFKNLVMRTNCSNTEFTSRNIMDYAISYFDQFTQDQYNRVQHILTYSPLIPRPKKGQAGTRTATKGLLDLPIRTIK